jgi:hypothetical protein
MRQPSHLSKAAIRRQPNRGRRRNSSITRFASAASSLFDFGLRRWADGG